MTWRRAGSDGQQLRRPFADYTPKPPATRGANADPFADYVPEASPADPTFLERAGVRPATEAEGVVGRAGVRWGLGGLDALVALPQALGGQLEKWGVSAPTPSLYDTNGAQLTGPGAPRQPLPSETAINALGLQAPPDQSQASQTVKSVLPWLIPTANTVSRVSEAPGAVTKLLTAGGSVMGELHGAGFADQL